MVRPVHVKTKESFINSVMLNPKAASAFQQYSTTEAYYCFDIMNRCSKPSAVYSTIDYSNLHETASAAYRCASC